MTAPKTLFDKIWESHLVEEQEDGTCVLYIDRHLVHEVTSPQAFEGLRMANRKVRRPQATLAVADHNVPTTDRSKGIDDEESRIQVEALDKNAVDFGIPYFGMNDIRQGVVHVIGPEQGFTQPGTTIVCGDSHTATHGAFGALAFGIGTSEVEHVLATQTLLQGRAKNMCVRVEGDLPAGFGGKDLILAIIGQIGTAGGTGCVIEFVGDAVKALSMEGRMSLCNMAIEGGARAGMVAPDEKTFAYLKGPAHGAEGRRLGQGAGLLEDAADRRGREIRRRGRHRHLESGPARHLGHQPAGRRRHRRHRARSAGRGRPRPPRRHAALARLHGPERGHQDDRYRHRHGVHRVLHQRPDRGLPRRRGRGQGPQGRRRRAGARPCPVRAWSRSRPRRRGSTRS